MYMYTYKFRISHKRWSSITPSVSRTALKNLNLNFHLFQDGGGYTWWNIRVQKGSCKKKNTRKAARLKQLKPKVNGCFLEVTRNHSTHGFCRSANIWRLRISKGPAWQFQLILKYLRNLGPEDYTRAQILVCPTRNLG